MTPEEFQKLQMLSSSNEELITVASGQLINEAVANGHCISNFTLKEKSINPNDKTQTLRAFCVVCTFEIEIEYNDNNTDIRLAEPKICAIGVI